MKLKYLFVTLVFVLFISGCNTQNNFAENPAGEDNIIGNSVDNSMYSGKVLAGSETLYLEFNQEDYEQALSENKIVLLYFYANWCPICRAEEPNTFDAFDEMNYDNVIGFRVNYKDSETDENEENLAKEFGITYQHTKVIIEDGEQVLKSLDTWDKQKYLDEINKLV